MQALDLSFTLLAHNSIQKEVACSTYAHALGFGGCNCIEKQCTSSSLPVFSASVALHHAAATSMTTVSVTGVPGNKVSVFAAIMLRMLSCCQQAARAA